MFGIKKLKEELENLKEYINFEIVSQVESNRHTIQAEEKRNSSARSQIDLLTQRIEDFKREVKADQEENEKRWNALKEYLGVEEREVIEYEEKNCFSSTLEDGAVINMDTKYYYPVNKIKLESNATSNKKTTNQKKGQQKNKKGGRPKKKAS